MKKLLSFIIAISMLLMSLNFAYASDDKTTNYNDEIKELKAIEILKNFNENELTTRGDFAIYLVRLMGFDENKISSNSIYFPDVPKESIYFNAVSFCVEKNLIKGYSDGYFRPMSYVKTEEALKMLITLLGYTYEAENFGTYPSSYIYTANKIGLTKGIKLPIGENLLNYETARLLYNAIDIPLVELKSVGIDGGKYEIDKDKTILTLYLKLNKISGVVSANDITGILGTKVSSDNSISIGDLELYFKDQNVRTLLGFNVDVIYSDDKNSDKKEIKYIAKNDKNKVINISNDDFVKIEEGKLYYNINDSSYDEKVEITKYFEFVYNGKSIPFDYSLITNAKNGYFTLISSGNNNIYDIVIFEDLKTLTVDRVNLSEKIIFNMPETGENLKISKDKKILIKDTYDKIINLENIGRYSVLSYYENDDIIVAYLSDTKNSGVITSLNGKEKEIVIDDVIYEFTKDLEYLYNTVSVGDKVTLYKDIKGKISYIEKTESDDREIVIPIGLLKEKNTVDNDISLKFFSVNNMKSEVLKIAENIKVNGNTESKITRERVKEIFLNDAPVLIKKNQNNEINYVEQAKSRESYSKLEDGFTTLVDNKNLYYMYNVKGYGNKVYQDKNTKLLIIPKNIKSADDSDFYLGEFPKRNTENQKISAYGYSKDNIYANLITMKKEDYSKMDVYEAFAVVNKVSNSIDKEGTPVLKISYFENGKEDYAYFDDYNMQSSGSGIELTAKDITKGDVIKINKDKDNNAGNFECIYKAKTGEFKYGNTDSNSTGNRITMGNIIKIDDEFITAELDEGIEYIKYASMNFTLLDNRKNNCFVKSGSVADAEVGDKFIFQWMSTNPKNILIIKK